VSERAHVDGALLVSWGAVHPGREQLALDTFTELSKFFGAQLTEGAVTSFQPFFYADGAVRGSTGFFLVEGRRDALDGLRRSRTFLRLQLQAGAAASDVRVDTLIAGPEAGRLANLYREVRDELGLL
jgi:hypothetical protein